MLTVEQVVASHKANLETLFGLTSKAFEGVEKLVELNVTASRAALNEAANHTQAVLSVKDVQELMALHLRGNGCAKTPTIAEDLEFFRKANKRAHPSQF